MKHYIKATCYDKRGNIISSGENSYNKSHPVQADYARRVGQRERIFLHAEILAIIRARGKDIHKIKIERYNSQGKQALALPCPICQLAIKEAGISVVEYTT